MVQLSATRCSCTATVWISRGSSAAITLCVRKLLDTPSYKTDCIYGNKISNCICPRVEIRSVESGTITATPPYVAHLCLWNPTAQTPPGVPNRCDQQQQFTEIPSEVVGGCEWLT
jgi:hypothetical protein